MYGYFRPKSSHLTEEEYKIFMAYYCRICYCLRLLGGQPARMFVTFDMAVYSLLLNLSRRDQRPEYHMCEHVGTRVMHSYDDDEIGHRLASMSVIAFGEKIRDDEVDGNRLRAAGMNLLYSGTVKKAQALEPEMAAIARRRTDEINALQDKGADLMEILRVYGSMIAEMFCVIGPLEEKFQRLFRAIAVWTFYIDMLYDYNKDYREGAYNGFRTEGLKKIHDYFDTHYPELIRFNRQITDEMREALHELDDDSPEWSVLRKLISQALGNTIPYLLTTTGEKAGLLAQSMWSSCPCVHSFRRMKRRMEEK